jgi:hypothetical protein
MGAGGGKPSSVGLFGYAGGLVRQGDGEPDRSAYTTFGIQRALKSGGEKDSESKKGAASRVAVAPDSWHST